MERRSHLLNLRILPGRMHAVRQQHHKKLPVRINPDRSAGKSRMPKTVRRKIMPARSALGRHCPAQCSRPAGKLLRRRELCNRRAPQNPLVRVNAAIQQHLAKRRQVRRRAEKSRMPRNAADRKRVFVGRYIVSWIPSGEKMLLFAKSSSVLPVNRSMISAIKIIPRSEYTSFVPGSYSSGSAKIFVIVSCLFFDVRQYSLNGGNPEVCVSKCRTVTLYRHSAFGPLAHSGKYRSIFASKSSGTAKSLSADLATSVVVATTFVSDAMSYIVFGATAAALAS